MKKLCYFATVILVLLQLSTATIGWPAGDAYSLVVKPYPSLLKQIPHMEQDAWDAAVATGAVPAWVVRGEYIELIASGHELEPPLLMHFYGLSFVLTAVLVFVTALLMVSAVRKKWFTKSVSRPSHVAQPIIPADACRRR